MMSQKISHINDMKNAKEEFLRTIENCNDKIKCAQIMHEIDVNDFNTYSLSYYTYSLRVGYTQKEYDRFVDSLDFEYDAGYGGQELFGNIWMEDGSWFERAEYDGSEWWTYKSTPRIPNELMKN